MKIIGKNHNKKPIEVEIEGTKIKNIKYLSNFNDFEIQKLNYIIPGFIDIHTHGGYGFDWISGDKEKMLDYLYKLAKYEGVTSVAGTTITTSHDKIMNTLKNFSPYINTKQNGSTFIGFHLEGPHINPLKKGAHPIEYMSPLTIEKIDEYLSVDSKIFKIITYAIEKTNVEVTKYLTNKGISGSVGHSMATGEDVKKHIINGLNSVTHYNNAMQKLDGNEDTSMAIEVLKNDSIYIEFINDGIHNSKYISDRVYNEKNKHKIILITDSLHIKGLDDGDYQGPNWIITKKNGAAWTPEGVLNGSTYTMNLAFKDWINKQGSTIEEAIWATSTNAADALKLNKGRLEVDYDADLVILNNDFKILKTIVNGVEIN